MLVERRHGFAPVTWLVGLALIGSVVGYGLVSDQRGEPVSPVTYDSSIPHSEAGPGSR